MQILKIHIDNFGKLSGLDLRLVDGLNTWLRDNGSGKTTLATFIAVMFYGFPDEKGRKISVETSMRELYRPWQGGKYGGNLVFSDAEGTWTVIREFADSPVRDRQEVLDQDGKRTERFGRIPGLEIFGISGDSFLRTVFIRDNELKAAVSDDVSARLGSLLDDTMDMNRYEDAQGRLKRLLDSMNPQRATGSLSKDKVRCAELKQKLRGKGQAEENLKRLNERVRGLENEAEQAAEEKRAVEQKIAGLVSYNALLADRRAYESLIAESTRRNNDRIRTRSQFPKDVPLDQELLDAQSAQRNAERLEQTIRDNTLTDEERETLRKADLIFATSSILPGETTEMYGHLERMQSENRKKDDLEKEVLTLRTRTAERKQKEADEARKRAQTEAEEAARKTADLDAKKKHLRALGILAAVAGAALGLVSLITAAGVSRTDYHLSFSYDELLPKLLLISGGVLLLLGILLLVLSLRQKNEEAGKREEAQETEANEADKADEAVLHELNQRISEAGDAVEEEEQKIRAYFSRFGVPYNETRVAETISALENLKKEQERILEKKNKGEAARELYNTARNAVRRFIVSLGLTPAEDLHEQLERIEDHLDAYRTADRENQKAREAQSLFERENDVERLKKLTPPDFPETLEELQEESRRIQQGIQEKKETALAFSREAEQAERVLEDMRDDEQSLAELEEKYDEDMRRYNLLTKAQDSLRTAKLSLSRKYASPVTEHFRKYLGQIIEKGEEDFRVDPEGKVLVEDHNEPRDVMSLSHGYRDLSYFCMRIALVDSMYQEERPPLILDDPFVNLDDEHVKRALALVKAVSEDYQVLYFTCSEARGIAL